MIKIPVVFSGLSHLANHGISLRFQSLNEVSSEDAIIAVEYIHKSGWLVFSDDDIQESDIPKENTEKGCKTHAQLLRSLLYVLWQQTKQDNDNDFEAFYRQRMQQFQNAVRKMLDKGE